MKNISKLLLALAFTQLASAETVPELIQEFSSIIDTRVSEAGQLIGLVGKNIGQTYSEIENSIRGTAQDLQNEIDNAQDLLKSQAKELAPNAAECVSAASSSLSSLSVDSLQSCSLSNELITVQKMIPQLAMIPRQLGTLIPRCIAGAQNDPIILRSCLSDGLQRIDESSTSLNSDVQSLMDKARDGAGKCIENARSVIDNSIASITDTLNDCVKGANDA